MTDDLHVIPIGDLREHELCRGCWCRPRDAEGLGIIVHNSADGREAYETGERKPS